MNEEPPLPADRTFQVGERCSSIARQLCWVLRRWNLGAADVGAWVLRRCPQISSAARRGAGFTPLPTRGMRPPFSFYKKENAPRPV